MNFRLRTLFALTAGLAFVSWILGWFVRNNGNSWIIALVLLWAPCALLGIFICKRQNRSTLLGSILGGACPIFLVVTLSFYFNNSASVSALPAAMLVFQGFGAGASALLAAIVGILGDGFSLTRPLKKDKDTPS